MTMKFSLILCAGALVLIVAPVAIRGSTNTNEVQPPKSLNVKTKRPKIVVVSDSLTNTNLNNWLALVQARVPGVELVAEAHGGWSTRSYFREHLAAQAFAKVPPDANLCIILIGSNNLFEAAGGSDAAVAEATTGVVRIIDHVRKLAPSVSSVLLLAPPTVALKNLDPATANQPRRVDQHSPVYLGKLSAAYRQLAAQQGWQFADLFPVLSDNDYVDVAHPNADGNRKLADVIVPALTAWVKGLP